MLNNINITYEPVLLTPVMLLVSSLGLISNGHSSPGASYLEICSPPMATGVVHLSSVRTSLRTYQ